MEKEVGLPRLWILCSVLQKIRMKKESIFILFLLFYIFFLHSIHFTFSSDRIDSEFQKKVRNWNMTLEEVTFFFLILSLTQPIQFLPRCENEHCAVYCYIYIAFISHLKEGFWILGLLMPHWAKLWKIPTPGIITANAVDSA